MAGSPRLVVSDASPLIALAAVGHLDVLRALMGAITIPPAVRAEIDADGGQRRGAAAIRKASWITVIPPRQAHLVETLRLDLDAGEAEALALALETQARLLLIDERRGRRRARALGVPVTGTAGIVALAKEDGLIPAVGPLLETLRRDAGLRLREAVVRRVLMRAGEAS
ncbi:MAG: DUF3368 domain-containing protein [Bacteroidota bacterium]